ncbi:MAG: LCP family protein [Anaerolineae bacterium]|nr:LCP family protein [Anaerolineae bacterium]
MNRNRRSTCRSRRPASSVTLAAVFVTVSMLAGVLCACGGKPAVSTAVVDSPSATPTRLSTDSLQPTCTPDGYLAPLPTVRAVARGGTLPATNSPTARPLLPSPTSTRLPTRTVSPTPSRTVTALPTSTRVPPTTTYTPTPTATGPTPTPSQTVTPTVTVSPTLTPTLTPTPMYSPTPAPTVSAAEEIVHFLLIGLDSRHNLGGQNTDVIMVALIDRETKQISLLSIPRDLWVYIPTHGWNRINMAHKLGHRTGYPGSGPGLLADTITSNFGIPIDHWARIDFEGFAQAVDELGGVDMVVACPVNLTYLPPESDEEEQIVEPGVYHLDGVTALRYVRTRRDGTDFDRARRQQQFLKAVWQQMKQPGLLTKIPGLWSALHDSFDTDLNLGDVLSLAPLALDLKPQRIRSRYIGYGYVTDWTNAEGWRVLLPRYDKIQELVASLYAPPSSSGDRAAGEEARVAIYNGTWQAQLALVAADQVRWAGVDVIETGPADRPGQAQTRILVHSDKPKTVELLVKELGVRPENVIQEPDAGAEFDVVVILGADYDPCGS